MSSLVRGVRGGAVLAAIMAVAACSDSGGTGTPEPEAGTLTVDASTGWALVDLDAGAQVAGAPDASTAWELGVFATSIMLNGGAAGTGGVKGFCVCQNASATDAQVQAMTAAGEQADFDAVTAAAAPADSTAWTSDALVPVITGWYAYNPATHVVSPAAGKAWKVRTAEGTGYAKLRVTGIEAPTQTTAGRVTIEYAVQAAKGGAMGAVKTATLDVSAGGRVYFDLLAGAVSTAADWDVSLQGYTLRVNGGVSGGGQAGAVVVADDFAAITDASDLSATLYRGDAYGGVFDAHRWYRYNVTGTDHQIWPTFDVYLVRRGAALYKVQIVGYYGPAGETRRITLRYQKVAG